MCIRVCELVPLGSCIHIYTTRAIIRRISLNFNIDTYRISHIILDDCRTIGITICNMKVHNGKNKLRVNYYYSYVV